MWSKERFSIMSTTMWSMLASRPAIKRRLGILRKRLELPRRHDVVDAQRLLIAFDPDHREATADQPPCY